MVFDPVVTDGDVFPGPPNAILVQRRGRGARIGVAPCRDLLGMRFLSIRQSCGVGLAADQHYTERHDCDGSGNGVAVW